MIECLSDSHEKWMVREVDITGIIRFIYLPLPAYLLKLFGVARLRAAFSPSLINLPPPLFICNFSNKGGGEIKRIPVIYSFRGVLRKNGDGLILKGLPPYR